MPALERELTIVAVGIRQAERSIEEADRILRPGTIRPRDDREIAEALNIPIVAVKKICEYIETGTIDLGLGNCPPCRGWGRFGDDIFCQDCNGTGDRQDGTGTRNAEEI